LHCFYISSLLLATLYRRLQGDWGCGPLKSPQLLYVCCSETVVLRPEYLDFLFVLFKGVAEELI